MNKSDPTRVTIVDIAREAKVSPKTVSRVIRGDDYVSQETLERVQKVIKELGYRPNRVARSLVSNESGVIGIIIPDITNPFFPEVVRGIENTAREQDYNILLFSTDAQLDRERAGYHFMEENQVDGIIVYFGLLPDAELELALARQKAAVIVDRFPGNFAAGVVRVDFYNAAVTAVNTLVSSGHRQLAYVSTPGHHYTFSERLRGISDATAAANIVIPPGWSVICETNLEASSRATRALLRENPEINGLLCFNDIIGIGALEACDELGIKVPDQVAIIGIDDIPLSRLNRIALTTMRVPQFEVGVQATQMLFNRIRGTAGPTEVVIQTELVERQTTLQHLKLPGR
jgi:LacI family transcriptional regulator